MLNSAQKFILLINVKIPTIVATDGIGYPSFIKDRIKLGSLQILALVQLQNFQNY